MKKLHHLFIAIALLFASNFAVAEVVNINTADATTLAANIVGIGEKKALAIVQFREEHGPFKSVDELTQVKGIGLKLVDNNRENLTVKSD
ncbi:MAG: ComEA family DNA-binding protein [Chromatiales bacterium]|nr:ComEA family DNA-binding protein [Chromatiales bacterium]